MRLIRLIGLIGLTSLVGCSSGEDAVGQPPTPLPTETAIAFSGSMTEEEVTRAGTPLHETGITYFTVWGFKNTGSTSNPTCQTVFPGYRVNYGANTAATTTTNSNNWEYILPAYPDQSIKYWDWSASAYRFFALTGYDNITKDETNGIYEITITADATNVGTTPYYSKLWFSTNTTARPFGDPVTLEFMQPFAKVRFMIILADPEKPMLLTDDDFRPSVTGQRIAQSAEFIVTYPLNYDRREETWSITDGSVGKTLAALTHRWVNADDTAEPPIAADHHWETVVPALNQGSYTFKVRVDGEDKSCVVPAQFMDWLPGFRYTYIFKVNYDGGVELASVHSAYTDWVEDVDNEHILYNW